MELNIINQIRALRQAIKKKPNKSATTVIKAKLEKLRPVIQYQQPKPKRKALRVVVEGREMTMKEIAEKYGINQKTVEARYRVGNRGGLLIRPSQKTYNHTHKQVVVT